MYVRAIFEEKLLLFRKRKSLETLIFPGFVSYLPQHCLYFLPLPHAHTLLVYIVFVLLLLFQVFVGQVTFGIYVIYSIYVTINISQFTNKLQTLFAFVLIFKQRFF